MPFQLSLFTFKVFDVAKGLMPFRARVCYWVHWDSQVTCVVVPDSDLWLYQDDWLNAS